MAPIYFLQEFRTKGTARDKLNSIYVASSVGIAALIAAVAGSWPLLVLIAAVLVGCAIYTGGIRPNGRRR